MEARFRWAAGATTWPQIKAKAGFFWGMEIQTAISESSSLQKAFSDLTLHQQRARPPRAVHEHDISFPHCFLPRVSQLPPSDFELPRAVPPSSSGTPQLRCPRGTSK